YSEVWGTLPIEYEKWNIREASDRVNTAIRGDYELRWTDKNEPNVYDENPNTGDRVMEHAIPVSQWVKAILASEGSLMFGVFFLAWAGPVVNISQNSDDKLKVSGEWAKNLNPNRPFQRYENIDAKILSFSDNNVNNNSLDNHYDIVFQIPFMEKLHCYAKNKLELDNAKSWLKEHFQY
ncbi:MAG: hypothetical protein V3R90_04690, partial [Limibaculum sp.]